MDIPQQIRTQIDATIGHVTRQGDLGNSSRFAQMLNITARDRGQANRLAESINRQYPRNQRGVRAVVKSINGNHYVAIHIATKDDMLSTDSIESRWKRITRTDQASRPTAA